MIKMEDEFLKIIGGRIKQFRKAAKLTQKELAEKCGASQSYIADLENGRLSPSLPRLNIIAKILGVKPSVLLRRNGDDEDDPDLKFIDYISQLTFSLNPATKIPVVGIIRAGEPILAEQNIIGYVELPADLAKDGEYFGLRVVGDSMNLDRICEGDIAIVRKQDVVDNGDIAVVLIDNENATIKRFYMTNTTVTLVPHSSNTEHQPRIIDLKKTSVKVLGKVVRAIINF